MKKGLNRDHQQQLQHHQSYNFPASTNSNFPFNSHHNTSKYNNYHPSASRHPLFNQVPQVQSQFTSLSLSHQPQVQQSPPAQQRPTLIQNRQRNSPPPVQSSRPQVVRSQQTEKWIPHSIKNAHRVVSGEEQNQAIFRQVRGILNKLTPEKFDKLVDGLISLGLNSPSLLKGVILLIFEKALEEPKYSCMYAQLCKKLSKELPNFESPVSSSASSDPPTNTFCRLLLIKCKDEFENRLKASERFNIAGTASSSSLSPGKNGTAYPGRPGLGGSGDRSAREVAKLSEEEEEAKTIAKSKMLGNIKFICELGKQGLVQENILHLCIRQLIQKKKEESFESKAQDLECLAQIMTTIGKSLDTEKARKLFDQYFERIEYYSKCQELPARIKFMLKDTIELRANNWVPRRVQREVAPKTITQIREEAAKEGINPHFYAHLNNQQIPGLFNGLPGMGSHFLNGSLLTQTSFSPGYKTQSNQFLTSGNQGQRALDDAGYYGPGIPPLNPNLQPIHPLYRGSNSQGNERSNQRGDNRNSRVSNSLGGVNQTSASNLPPRFRPKDSNVPTANKSQIPPSINSTPISQDGYFGPAKDSLVQLSYNSFPSSGSPRRDSARSSPASGDGSSSLVPQVDPKQVLLTDVSAIMDDLLAEKMEIEEAVSKIKKLKIPKANQNEVVKLVIKKTLDESSTDTHREVTSCFVAALNKQELVVKSSNFINVIKQLLTQLSDLEVNDPLIKTHMAEIISRAVSTEVISLKDAFDLVKNYFPMFLLCLQQLRSLQGETWLIQAVESSKISLMAALPESDRTKESLADILEKRSLDFLQPLLRVESDLAKLLLIKNVDPSENISGDGKTEITPSLLYTWIKENVDPTLQMNRGFIHILVCCVVKNIMDKAKEDVAELVANNDSIENDSSGKNGVKTISDCEKERLKGYQKMLQKLLGSKASLQLAAIYALQTVCYELKFPKGLLVRWFDMFYDMEIVDEEVFFVWKEQVTDEFPGKGQALFQVNSWLTWLEEAADEEDEEDDETEVIEGNRPGKDGKSHEVESSPQEVLDGESANNNNNNGQ